MNKIDLVVCAYCVKQFQIKFPTNLNISHGVCKRHYREELKKLNIPDDSIDLLISKHSECCKDLAEKDIM